MRKFLSKRYKEFISDKIQWSICATSVVLLVCHIWQFYDSQFMFQPLSRIVLYSILIPAVFVFGRKAIFVLFLIFAYVAALDITFENYTSFIVVMIISMVNAKDNFKKDLKIYIPYLAVYAACALISCQRHDKDASHIVIHIANCFWLFFITYIFIKKGKKKKHLKLDDVQKKILSELASGKLQKEITFVNKNTIKNKIQKALVDNDLLSKEQLLMLYIREYVEFE